MMRPDFRYSIGTLLLATVLLASCATGTSSTTDVAGRGSSTSSSPSSSDDGTETNETATSSTTARSTTVPSTRAPSSSSVATATTASSAEPSGADVGAYCDVMRRIEHIDDDSDAITSGTGDMKSDLEKIFGDFRDVMNDATEVAPAEIKADMVMLRDAIAAMADALENSGGMENFDRVVDRLDSPSFEQAGDRVTAYVKRTCDIDLDDATVD